jgi:hypothetical protein
LPLKLQNTKKHKKEKFSFFFLVKFRVLVFLPRSPPVSGQAGGVGGRKNLFRPDSKIEILNISNRWAGIKPLIDEFGTFLFGSLEFI